MSITPSILDFLRRERAPFTTFRHRLAYTAQEEAALAHVRGRSWAKTVVCFADDEPVQAVLAAHMMVDLERLAILAGARRVRLATEAEIRWLYPECEVGGMPPFGPLYRQRVFLDTALEGDPQIVFNAGNHTDAICMEHLDFIDIVKPVIGSFAVREIHTA